MSLVCGLLALHIGDNAASAVYMGQAPNPRAIAKTAALAVVAVLPWAF